MGKKDKNDSGINIEVQKYNDIIQKNINKLINAEFVETGKEPSQKDIVERAEAAGFQISQATVSNMKNGKGNTTLLNLLAIAKVFNVSIEDLLRDTSAIDEYEAEQKLIKDDVFIYNFESQYVAPYRGMFHVAFFKTSGSTTEMVRGTLQIEKSEDGEHSVAILKLELDENDTETGEAAQKVYIGELAVSLTMRAVYVTLSNDILGEKSMLIFQHLYTNFKRVETVMAVCVTTASGSNRRPTVHRMALTRKKITPEKEAYFKGQLLMNTSDIYLSADNLEALCNHPDIPDSFKEVLHKAKNSPKMQCYCIPEGSLYDGTLSESEYFESISIVRSKSKAEKYNKVSKKSDEALYALMGNKSKKS